MAAILVIHRTRTIADTRYFSHAPQEGLEPPLRSCYNCIVVQIVPVTGFEPACIQLLFQLFRRQRRYTGMNSCLNCPRLTSNPRFCSRSCAATWNNRMVPKRNPEGICGTCDKPISKSRKYCSDCLVISKSKSSNSGSNPYIRQSARKSYVKSGRPMTCILCGYTSHVDICHIKDIRDYPDGTLYSVINDDSNLIALCKNHHWEFDHGIL